MVKNENGNPILNFLKKESTVNLSVYFICVTCILIMSAIGLIAAYVTNHINQVSQEYNDNLKTFNYSLSTILSRTFDENYKNNELHKSTYTTQILLGNSTITYAYAIDKKTRTVFWSTIPVILNKTVAEAQGEINFEHESENVEKVLSVKDNYTLVLGLPKEKISSSHLEVLTKKIKLISAFFLLVALIASFITSRIILNPLFALIKGVEGFSRGNFNSKLKGSNFSEINHLAQTFNTMAHQLDELYTSLEAKVKERTIALEHANQEIKDAQAMMVHSEKMRSLGELVAGIAHEINNPINFIYGNIIILEKYVKDIYVLFEAYQTAEGQMDENSLKEIKKIKKQMDYDFIKDDIKDLLKSCVEGTDRTKNIVLDLKNFSRMEEMVLTQFDIPKEIDTTLNILNNKYKNRITVHKDYGNVPKIEAYGGQLNQVFMNILDNAQYAIEGEGDVRISVKQIDENVEIIFTDSGKGIKEENLTKVFEPFFTTKPVGEGTGLGMSISYRVIKNHGGEIYVQSEVGKGTTFTIQLPINLKAEDTAQEEKQEVAAKE